MIFKIKKRNGNVITKDGTLDGVWLRWDGMGFFRFDVEGRKVKVFIRHRETELPLPVEIDPEAPLPGAEPPEPLDEFDD